MSKHTPGPWSVDEPHQVFASSVGEYVAITKVEDFETIPKDQCEANARLIAAAPELLEALLQIIQDAKSPEVGAYLNLKLARAAIAKATGETE